MKNYEIAIRFSHVGPIQVDPTIYSSLSYFTVQEMNEPPSLPAIYTEKGKYKD